MNYEKALYFVSKEKKVKHIGFTTPSGIHLLESRELLSQHGFQEDPSFFRETDDAVYVFSSVLPQHVIDSWFDQIHAKKSTLEKAKKGKVEKIEKHDKARKPPKPRKAKKPAKEVKKRPRKKSAPRQSTLSDDTEKRIQTLKALRKKKKRPLSEIKMKKSRKTLDMLKEEVKAQRRWEAFVPTCGECTFWERRYLKFTELETGECSVTGNFVSEEKKACSEFERR